MAITYGTIDSLASQSRSAQIAKISATSFIIAYSNSSNSHGVAKIGTIATDGTITYGSPFDFDTVCDDYPYIKVVDSTHFVVAYSRSGVGKAIIGVFSGSTISSVGS